MFRATWERVGVGCWRLRIKWFSRLRLELDLELEYATTKPHINWLCLEFEVKWNYAIFLKIKAKWHRYAF